MPLSRRDFARLLAVGGAVATLPAPALSAELAGARRHRPRGLAADAVLLNFNEHPLGPCAEARDAVVATLGRSGRYLFDDTQALVQLVAASLGVPADHVLLYAGSSLPLHLAVLEFCGRDRAFVMGDPGYEGGAETAEAFGYPVMRVPLLAGSHAHDVERMTRVPNAGLVYICTPNNPTGTVTPRAALDHALARKPAGSVLLVDEAYHHFCDEPGMLDRVRAGDDIVVLRTFSKLYGMAGLRLGVAIAPPALLARFRRHRTGPLPVLAIAAGRASLEARGLVAERKQANLAAREPTLAWLRDRGMAVTASQSNCFMFDAGRPTAEVIRAMAAQGVLVGRPWKAWPTWVRVSVGTADEMARFREAAGRVLA